MNIVTKNQAIHIDKPEGSSVDYYLFSEYEVHYNEIKPGTVQAWHHHTQISESIFVIFGEIEAHWLDDKGQKHMKIGKSGDLVEVGTFPHTFINSSQEIVKFIVFRFVPTGEDKREIIKNDKVVDEAI